MSIDMLQFTRNMMSHNEILNTENKQLKNDRRKRIISKLND